MVDMGQILNRDTRQLAIIVVHPANLLSHANATRRFIGAIVAGTATLGSSVVTLLAMLGLILSALRLPLEAVIILFIVFDPIVAPFLVLASVHGVQLSRWSASFNR